MPEIYLWLGGIAGVCFVAFVIVLFTQQRSPKLVAGQSRVPWLTKPTATIEMEHLHFMLGTWIVYETWERGPWGGTFKGKSVFKTRLGPANLSIITDIETVGPHGRSFTHIVSSWNPYAESYEGCSVSNLDYGVLFWRGKWEENNLVFEGELVVQGKKIVLQRVLSDIKSRSYTTQEYITEPGDQRRLVVTGKAKRKI